MTAKLVNAKKSVDRDPDTEIQGMVSEPSDHWLGVAVEKRVVTMAATIDFLCHRTPRVKARESILGKHSYSQSPNPESRPVFGNIYAWTVGKHTAGQLENIQPGSDAS